MSIYQLFVKFISYFLEYRFFLIYKLLLILTHLLIKIHLENHNYIQNSFLCEYFYNVFSQEVSFHHY